jgi:hypothetical protein
VVLVGIAIAAVGVWYAVRSRPIPGQVIDTVVIDPHESIVVRAEQGGDRAFVELHVDGKLRWQAFVPPYAGRPDAPGVAWSPIAISVRVIRGDRAEVFALSRNDASKLGGVTLASGRGPIDRSGPGPITLTDHVRSYELVSGPGWHEVVAVDLNRGERLWSTDLGPAAIQAAGLEREHLWVEQSGSRRRFAVSDGRALAGNNM